MITWKEIGERLHAARVDSGISQSELARALGVDTSAVSRIESGQRKVDSLELATVSDAVGRPVWWFLEERPKANRLFMREEAIGDESRRHAVTQLEGLVSDLLWLRTIGD